MKTVLLVRMGEIFLKGDNRNFFIKALVRNLRKALEGTDCTLELTQGRIFLRDIRDMDEVIRRATRVFGVHSVSPVVECEKDMEVICARAIELMENCTGTFKCVARRADKRFPLDSMQINEEVGYRVLSAHPGLKVDVHKPEHELSIEIRERAYLYVEKIPAVGGMPVGTGGKAMLLLSGGIDSPVSSYMIAKRGVKLEMVHFFSPPYTSDEAKEKVLSLAKLLVPWCGRLTVQIVPFTEIQEEIRRNCPEEFFTLIMRRFMMRISQRVADQVKAKALVTGENLGQVASQTMEALRVTEDVVDLPVLRPLIGMDKEEIVRLSRKIGTFDTSILPYEDCCTVFTPRHPRTKPNLDEVREAEAVLDIEGLIDRAMTNREFVRIKL